MSEKKWFESDLSRKIDAFTVGDFVNLLGGTVVDSQPAPGGPDPTCLARRKVEALALEAAETDGKIQ